MVTASGMSGHETRHRYGRRVIVTEGGELVKTRRTLHHHQSEHDGQSSDQALNACSCHSTDSFLAQHARQDRGTLIQRTA